MNEIKIIEKTQIATPEEIVMGTLGISLSKLIADIIDSGPDGKYGALYIKATAEDAAG